MCCMCSLCVPGSFSASQPVCATWMQHTAQHDPLSPPQRCRPRPLRHRAQGKRRPGIGDRIHPPANAVASQLPWSVGMEHRTSSTCRTVITAMGNGRNARTCDGRTEGLLGVGRCPDQVAAAHEAENPAALRHATGVSESSTGPAGSIDGSMLLASLRASMSHENSQQPRMLPSQARHLR